MMLMGYWSCAVQPGTAMTAHGDDEVRRHKGCRTFLLRPRAPRPSDPELPHAEANLPTRYPTHWKQRGGSYGADAVGAQATAQSERTKPVLVANRFHAISQASMMSGKLRNTELASQWLRR